MPNRGYPVRITEAAERDLETLYDYLAEHRSPEQAAELIALLSAKVKALAAFPGRGAVPKELEAMGAREYRQIVMRPYRMIYSFEVDTVFIHLIADGRRDLQALLARRLL